MDREAWDRRYAGKELVWSAGPNALVRAECEGLPAGKALDLAAGEGRNALWLAERGFEVVAVDFSGVALDKARAAAQARGVEVTLRQEDLAEWAPPARTFDLVLIAYLQIPWAQMQRVLRNAAEAVAEGGTFLLVSHDRDNLERGYGGPQSASVLHTAAQIAGELEGLQEGLQVERAEQVERRVATDDGERIAIDNIVRAHRPAQSSAPSSARSSP